MGVCGFLGLIFSLERRKDGVRVTERGEVVGGSDGSLFWSDSWQAAVERYWVCVNSHSDWVFIELLWIF